MNKYTESIGVDKLMDTYNMIVGGVVAVLTMILGKYWFLFAFFLLLNIVDFISGTMKARYLGTESSKMGSKGISKKVWYWVIILISFITSYCFISLGKDFLGVDLSMVQLLGWYTLASYTVNELRSIIENLVEMDINVPEVFTKGLAVIQLILKKKEEEIK